MKSYLGVLVALGLVAVVLIFSVIAIPNAFAQGNIIRSCVKTGNGDVRIIGPTEACKRNESLLTWDSRAGDRGRGLLVVDSLGQVVGALVFPGTNQFASTAGLPMVAFAVNGTHVSLRVTRNFLCGGDNQFSALGCSGIVFYTTPDCTGQPYLWPFGPSGVPGDLFGTGVTLFNGESSRADFYAIPGTAQRLVMGSRLEHLPAETHCTTFGASGDFMPALPLDLSHFKPPFSIH